jgi:hypothetical protein
MARGGKRAKKGKEQKEKLREQRKLAKLHEGNTLIGCTTRHCRLLLLRSIRSLANSQQPYRK